MSLFALEVGQSMSDRSLECALASALSVASYNDSSLKGAGEGALGTARNVWPNCTQHACMAP